MDVLMLKDSYEKRIEKIKKWNKSQEPVHKNTIKIVTIFLSIFAVIGYYCLLFIKYKTDTCMQFIISIILFVGIIIYTIIVAVIDSHLGKKMGKSSTNRKGFISDFDMKRLKSLRRLLIKENICFDDVEKIQIIIDELNCKKNKIIPFDDINKFMINPLGIIIITGATIFLDHFTESGSIGEQSQFWIIIFSVTVVILIIVLFIIKPFRWILYNKYDDFIDDLKLLQVINYK